VQLAGCGHLVTNGLYKRGRKQGDAVFCSFSVADDNLAAFEFDILNAQTQALQ
jgi:hypothetical protein